MASVGTKLYDERLKKKQIFPCLLWLADDTVSSKSSCLCSAIFFIIFYILFFDVVSMLCVSWHCAFICLNLLCYQRYTGRYQHSHLHSLLLSGCADALVFHKNLFFCTFPLIRHKYFHGYMEAGGNDAIFCSCTNSEIGSFLFTW